ncbi:MAG TPA: fumarate reductase cytochrome b subunit [Casimicrobiaceae bacterium]|nr:fumarate reductase cytochrome b subunit [Casimicrobiaceae bacterium]
MHNDIAAIAGAGLADRVRPSRWPARLDLAQSGSGLLLALFMWVHMFFVASILLGKDAMWAVARFFEGYYVFGTAHPIIVSFAVATIMTLIAVHAALAVRKFPANYRQFSTFRNHMRVMHHEDTTLWFWQLVTGFALFFLAFIHLYLLLVRPDRIGPFESADRVWSDHLWPLYIVLLLAVEVHGTIGLYRLAVKWGWFMGKDATVTRHRLKIVKWVITAFFLVLGAATLAAYIKIGIEHQDRYGERYTPASAAATPAAHIAPVTVIGRAQP